MSLGKPGPYRSPPPRKSRRRSSLCIPARQPHSHTTSRLPQAGSILQSKSAASHHGRGASYFVSSESLFQLLCPAPDIPGSAPCTPTPPPPRVGGAGAVGGPPPPLFFLAFFPPPPPPARGMRGASC